MARDEEKRASLDRRRRSAVVHTRLVRSMKILLPLAALALVALIFLQSRERGSITDLLTAEELARLGAGLRLENPRLAGVTESGEPYTVTADWAMPDSAMPEHVEFEKPRGRVDLADGRTLTMQADKGDLTRSEDLLTLEGNVAIETSDGYVMRTGTLIVDFGRNRADAPGPVSGRGPQGEIDAGSMRAVTDGKRLATAHIWFENRVRVLFIPERGG